MITGTGRGVHRSHCRNGPDPLILVPPLRLGAKVIVSAPLMLLAAMMASRSEMRPSAPGRSLIVLVPQGSSALKGESAVSVRVVTMVLATAGEARPSRARQPAKVSKRKRENTPKTGFF